MTKPRDLTESDLADIEERARRNAESDLIHVTVRCDVALALVEAARQRDAMMNGGPR